MEYSSSQHPPLKTVIFDYGAVLTFAPSESNLTRLASAFDLDAKRFLPHYFEERDPLDRGDISAETYWTTIANRTGIDLLPETIDSLRHWDIETWSDLNPKMLAWVDALKTAGYVTGLLSNMHADMARYAQANFTWLSKFDHLTISHEIHRVKPEPEIFLHSLRGLGDNPSSTLFIDDREANVAAARQLGIVAIQFESETQLSRELNRIGFPLLPNLGGNRQ